MDEIERLRELGNAQPSGSDDLAEQRARRDLQERIDAAKAERRPSGRRGKRTALLLAAAMALGLGVAIAANLPTGPDSPVIVGVDQFDGNQDIVLWTLAGDERRLTTDPGMDGEPRWSPDGTKIVYASGLGGPVFHSGISVLDVATGQVTEVLGSGGPGPSSSVNPSWSPDGSEITFAGYNDEMLTYNLWVINADGTGLRKLADDAVTTDGFRPLTWSPVGKTIVFAPNRMETSDLAQIDVATGTVMQLTHLEPAVLAVESPRFSPNGSQIAFVQQDPNDPGAYGYPYVMNADGTDVREVGSIGIWKQTLAWSDDNHLLVLPYNTDAVKPPLAVPAVVDVRTGAFESLGFRMPAGLFTQQVDWNPAFTYPTPGPNVPEVASVVPSPGPSTSEVGTVTGHLYAVGGPAPGSPSPLNGTVTVVSLEMTPSKVATVPVGADGAFSIDVPPGQYELTGTSPLYNGGKATCRAVSAVTVQVGGSVTTSVYCQEK